MSICLLKKKNPRWTCRCPHRCRDELPLKPTTAFQQVRNNQLTQRSLEISVQLFAIPSLPNLFACYVKYSIACISSSKLLVNPSRNFSSSILSRPFISNCTSLHYYEGPAQKSSIYNILQPLILLFEKTLHVLFWLFNVRMNVCTELPILCE